jgi:hypothetical protein
MVQAARRFHPCFDFLPNCGSLQGWVHERGRCRACSEWAGRKTWRETSQAIEIVVKENWQRQAGGRDGEGIK